MVATVGTTMTPGLVEARGSDGWDDLTPGLVEARGSDGWDDLTPGLVLSAQVVVNRWDYHEDLSRLVVVTVGTTVTTRTCRGSW